MLPKQISQLLKTVNRVTIFRNQLLPLFGLLLNLLLVQLVELSFLQIYDKSVY